MSVREPRKRRPGVFRTPRFFHYFRRSTAAASSFDNEVRLFKHGGQFHPALLEAINSARQHICCEFYIIRNDATGHRFAEALIAAVRRGVRVYLIYDYIGCIDTPTDYFRRLEARGVHCLPFNKPPFRRGITWFDRRNHRKFVVIDGITAYLGGLNVGNEYAGFGDSTRHWRDFGISLSGDAVLALQSLFLQTWQDEGSGIIVCPELRKLGKKGNAHVMIVSGTPSGSRSFISSAFRLAIAGAASSVKITTPYFIPGPRVVRSLLRAAYRGVNVEIILPALTDVPIVRMVSRSFFSPLLKAGIKIYERERTILHAKVMIIDDCWTTVGSANLDMRSFHRNFELNVVVDDADFGEEVAAVFAEELLHSRPISLAEHEGRGWLQRLMERVLAPVSWYL